MRIFVQDKQEFTCQQVFLHNTVENPVENVEKSKNSVFLKENRLKIFKETPECVFANYFPQ
jgi:hypothetical protein